MPDYDLLRVEANPAKTWQELTEQQQLGLEKLLKMLEQAVKHSKDVKNSKSSSKLPWLNYDKCSQLAFIDGKRGTGKSTLMATLVSLLLSADKFCDGNDSSTIGRQANKNRVCELAKSLGKHIIILEPLDMEPLPSDTPILAAILARLERAVQHYCGDSPSRGLLDNDLDDDRDVIRFQQFKAKIARALDSNLESRKSSLDREQFGQAVNEQEDDRLELIPNLTEVLAHLSKAIGGASKLSDRSVDSSDYLFLVPVDDVDLNPKRCLELLRLLRTYSPPQMFFLLMGQFDIVELIVRQRILREHDASGSSSNALNQSDHLLTRELTEIASANLQKMIPVRVELKELSLKAILEFRPLNASALRSNENDKETATLGELFKRITFDQRNHVSTPPRLPEGINNLLDLLNYSENSEANANGLAKLGDYPGLHTFKVSPRRLVDLWNQLHQLLVAGEKPLDEELLGVFQQHWKRIVDEDPDLDSESRRRLREDGISSCEVSPNPNRVFGWTRPTKGGEIPLPPTKQDPEPFPIIYRPTLRFIDDGPGTGIPFLSVKGRFITAADNQIPVVVKSNRTRAAFVLLHDLTAFISNDDANQIKMPAIAKMQWEGEGTASVPWPTPALPTFVKFTQLTRELRKSFQKYSKQPERFHFDTAKFVLDWIEICDNVLGLESIPHEEMMRRPTQLQYQFARQWLLQSAMMYMPECSGTLVPTRQRRFERRLYRVMMEMESMQKIIELRTAQLEPFVTIRDGLLYNEFARLANEFPFRIPPVKPKFAASSFDEMQQLRKDIRSDLKATEESIARSNQVSRALFLNQQAAIFANRDPDISKDYYEAAARIIQEELPPEASQQPQSQLVLVSALNGQGDMYLKLGNRDQSLVLFKQALSIGQRLEQEDPKNTKILLELLDAYNRVGGMYLEQSEHSQAQKMFEQGLNIAKRLQGDDPANPIVQRQSERIQALNPEQVESSGKESVATTAPKITPPKKAKSKKTKSKKVAGKKAAPKKAAQKKAAQKKSTGSDGTA